MPDASENITFPCGRQRVRNLQWNFCKSSNPNSSKVKCVWGGGGYFEVIKSEVKIINHFNWPLPPRSIYHSDQDQREGWIPPSPPPAGGHCSGRYASYWDAFFFSRQFLLSASALYHGLIRFVDCKNTPSLGFTPHFQIVNIDKIHEIKINDKRTLCATFTKFKQFLPHSHVKLQWIPSLSDLVLYRSAIKYGDRFDDASWSSVWFL